MERVGRQCFQNTKLEEFVTPNGLRSIEYGALLNCDRLKRLTLGEGLEWVGGPLYDGRVEELRVLSRSPGVPARISTTFSGLRVLCVSAECCERFRERVPRSARVIVLPNA